MQVPPKELRNLTGPTPISTLALISQGFVGVDTYGWGISQTLKDGEYVLLGMSRGGLLFLGQGDELVVTLSRVGHLHGGRKAREDLYSIIGVRYCRVVSPWNRPR